MHKTPNKLLKIPDKIPHLFYITPFNPIMDISWGKFFCIYNKPNTTYNYLRHKIFIHPSPLAPGLLSLFLVIPCHTLNIPLLCHNHPGSNHLGGSILVWEGTGTDKACGTLFPLIQITLHVKGGSGHMGKYSLSTLDGPYNLWSIFLNIYAQRGNNHTHDYFQYILIFCWP